MSVSSFRQAVVERKIELAKYTVTMLGRAMANSNAPIATPPWRAATCTKQKPICRICVANFKLCGEPQQRIGRASTSRLEATRAGALHPN